MYDLVPVLLDCGDSRRVHSPNCGGWFGWGENTEIISPSNLTAGFGYPILRVDRVLYTP